MEINNPKRFLFFLAWFILLPSRPALALQKATNTEFARLSKLATTARGAHKTDEAIDLYRKCLKLKPLWDQGWWYLGTLYYDADRCAEALPAFRNLVILNPKLGPAYALLGLCEFETHDYKNSLIHLQHSRGLGLGDNQDLVNVARYHEALLFNTVGEFEAAMELLAPLPSRGVVSEDVKVALGLTLLRVPLLPAQIDPSNDALIHAAGAIAEMTALSNFDQADVAFQKALKDFPDTHFLHYAYGSMLTILTRFDEAEREFKEEIKTTPDSPLPYMELAFVYLRIHRNQDALSFARQAVKLAPQSFVAYYILGRALLELGTVADSIQELETARRLGPFSPEVHYNLARAYTRANRKSDAERERADFARLSATPAGKQQQSDSQSYRSTSDRGALGPEIVNQRVSNPQKSPQ